VRPDTVRVARTVVGPGGECCECDQAECDGMCAPAAAAEAFHDALFNTPVTVILGVEAPS